ncbi:MULTISPECIES: NAD kinase [Flavobacterium]|uniref:NAD kinase n=2 Tax=Flavobacterium TaxID=237 RepID=A0AA94F3D3_9FLAO|nr:MULTISPECIES: NAD kinase [Flavobacterium]OXA83045.1 NAD kinase [Flavobacterium columnare] [Flavobacterium columnare NBRC 100251 = ATCC 23463]AMA50172.1 NAD(+) kinase [Flavobacterium covae]AND64308.1 NAD kinase [Flavobacterium covae]MCH4829387.1 NAD kinase [Flavobacterium columnare]MCH4834163.1 NAD kinase [Flavobacterium columnare]
MKVAIYGQYYQNTTAPIIERLILFLKTNAITFTIEANFLKILQDHQITMNCVETFSTHSDLDNSYQMVLSVGGDGTFLRAATFVRDSEIPILGINAGRLGFLANVQQENIEKFLTLVLEKKYTISERTLLSVTCSPELSSLDNINFAMNEITVNRKDTTSMITIETYLNDEYLTSYWADGLIISTPTGSTGYSLSCGGPILTPETESFVITPIAPHNLNARPMVIPDSTILKLKVTGREENYLVSLDSRISSVKNESILTIKKTPFKIKMVEITEETFLKTLRKKLLFGEDRRN